MNIASTVIAFVERPAVRVVLGTQPHNAKVWFVTRDDTLMYEGDEEVARAVYVSVLDTILGPPSVRPGTVRFQ